MNILFYNHENGTQKALREFVRETEGRSFFADNTHDAVVILKSRHVDLMFFEFQNSSDAEVLEYVNRKFTNVRIVMTVEKELEMLISAFKNCNYALMPKPFGLAELKKTMCIYATSQAYWRGVDYEKILG